MGKKSEESDSEDKSSADKTEDSELVCDKFIFFLFTVNFSLLNLSQAPVDRKRKRETTIGIGNDDSEDEALKFQHQKQTVLSKENGCKKAAVVEDEQQSYLPLIFFIIYINKIVFRIAF